MGTVFEVTNAFKIVEVKGAGPLTKFQGGKATFNKDGNTHYGFFFDSFDEASVFAQNKIYSKILHAKAILLNAEKNQLTLDTSIKIHKG